MRIIEVDWNDEEVNQLRNEQQADLGKRYGFDPELDLPEPDGLVCMLKLLDDQGNPAGCIALVDQTGVEAIFGSQRTVEMQKVYVRPEYRGNGYSYMLVDEVHKIGRDRGYEQIVLVTGVEQPEAVAVYTRMGYLPLEPYGFNAQFDTSLFFKYSLV